MKRPHNVTHLTRRAFLLAGAATPLAGCQAPYGVDYKTVAKALAVSTGLEEPPRVTREQAAQVPYSSLGYRLGRSGEQMLVLASQKGGRQVWASSARRILETAGGRIVTTAGFKWNLTGAHSIGNDPVAGGLQRAVPLGDTTRYADFRDIGYFGVRLQGHFTKKRDETITILGTKLQTIAVVERCHCEEFDWEFENEFWADHETGFIWRSRQHTHPNLDPFLVEILRPPG